MVSSSSIFAAACLLGSALANHPQSVALAAFKNLYNSSGLIPDGVLPRTLDPSVQFYAKYTNQDGREKLLTPGVNMIAREATMPGEFAVENIANATDLQGRNVSATTRYCIYLMDADAPDRNNPASRNLRLFLGGNYTLTNQPGVLGTSFRFNTSSPPCTPFQQPAPRSGSGIHRYVYALYVQPERFNSVGFEVAMSEQRENWNLSEWRTQLGLGPAIGATFFTINTDPNFVTAAAPGLSAKTSAFAAVMAFAALGAFLW